MKIITRIISALLLAPVMVFASIVGLAAAVAGLVLALAVLSAIIIIASPYLAWVVSQGEVGE